MAKLQLVKKAVLENNGEDFTIKHYDTVIYTYNTVSRISVCLMDCSRTSNKQIRMANDFFKPIEVREQKSGYTKWSFSH